MFYFRERTSVRALILKSFPTGGHLHLVKSVSEELEKKEDIRSSFVQRFFLGNRLKEKKNEKIRKNMNIQLIHA